MRDKIAVVVNRPIEEVWEFLMDFPFHAPRARGWTLGIRTTPPGPIRVGTTAQQRVEILGVETTLSGVVTELARPNHVTFSVTGGAGLQSGSIRVTLESTADGTKLAIGIELKPRPAFEPLWWIAGPFLKRRWRAANQALKRLLEAGRG